MASFGHFLRIMRVLTGRRVIYTNESEITKNNILDVLNDALITHAINADEIEYLYQYYKGKQPILERIKQERPEICNKIIENRANEIVSFKVGYLFGEPIQYINRSNESKIDDINRLNDYAFIESKSAKDKELGEWQHICGTSYRIVLPNPNFDDDYDESPFEIYTLDPRNTFVVYSNDLEKKPLMGVTYKQNVANGIRTYSCYTENSFFIIFSDGRIFEEEHSLKNIPIIEYPLNNARLGAFEIVLPLLDAINDVESNRLDGVEQFIQSLLVFKGVDIDSEEFASLRENGGLKIPIDADVDYLVQELNQSQTQELQDNLYQSVLTICGMPNRNGGNSTSDTGSAVIMRDGWSSAEARAKDTEEMFRKSEKQFLKIVLNITRKFNILDLALRDIEIRFTRRNYENILEKSQVLITMLNNPKIHPELAFAHCGMFSDPSEAYMKSMEYFDANKGEEETPEVKIDSIA